MLISSAVKPEIWQERLNFPGLVIALPAGAKGDDPLALKFAGAACNGAAARLVGAISRDSLAQAIRAELAPLGEAVVARNLEKTGVDAYWARVS